MLLKFQIIIASSMPKRQKDEDYDNSKEPKKYHTLISPKRKEKLIELVVKDNLTIYKAAKRLKICHPTAKFIMKNYRKSIAVKIQEGSPEQRELVCKKEEEHVRQDYQVDQMEIGQNELVEHVPNAPLAFPEQAMNYPHFWFIPVPGHQNPIPFIQYGGEDYD